MHPRHSRIAGPGARCSTGILLTTLLTAACGTADEPPASTAPAVGGGGSGGSTSATSVVGGAGGGGHGFEGALDLNDVTLLLPLPQPDTLDAHLWLFPDGDRVGPELPAPFEEELPPLQGDLFNLWGSTLVTALRFDPCARATRDAPCEAELRLVVQPVFVDAEGAVSMPDDSAGHIFYRVPPADVAKVVDHLAAIKALSPTATSGALRVHPGLEAATLDSPVGAELRTLVTGQCTTAHLRRVTINFFNMDNWGFLRFEVEGGALVPTPLPGMVVDDTSQSWIRQAQQNDLTDPSGTISPAPIAARDFSYLLSSASFASGLPVDAATASEAAERLLRVENPRLTLVDESDCVSCHLSTQARRFARRNGVDFEAGTDAYEPPPGVDASVNLAPELDGNLSATIQLGYHSQRQSQGDPLLLPSISARVIFESAEVLSQLDGD